MSENVFECDICFNDFDQAERTPKLLPCGHTFCLACLLAVVRSDSSCPKDRKLFPTHPLELETNYQIFAWLGGTSRSRPAADGKKLFVARIPPEATETDIQLLFTQFGDVKETVLIRALSGGHYKKYGFVTFQSEDSAQLALRNQPILLDGSRLFVDGAKPKGNNSVAPNQQGQAWVPPGYPYSHRVFVEWIPRGLKDSQLIAAFSKYGAVEAVRCERRAARRNHAFVTFALPEAVDRACRDQVVVTSTGHRLRFRRLRECEPPSSARRPAPQRQPAQRPHHRRQSGHGSERVILTQPDCCSVQ
ncbi:heterogeneous nuclear ribonucleoprotein A1-like [Thrips palmi]|uniref:Heterogeneous nuclear ribonucleoprotein A1-like n=1 Tax=Thrips palmi TaxID=161013 RepID=A0A6P8YNM3_THRPL|nr:heterogeneous nuclear ribonucleoprotein A1-like [Thrips palmi]